jgi:hypothetical protein
MDCIYGHEGHCIHVCAMMLSAQSHARICGSFGVVNAAVDHPGISLCHEFPVNRQISIVGTSNRKGNMSTSIAKHAHQTRIEWCM